MNMGNFYYALPIIIVGLLAAKNIFAMLRFVGKQLAVFHKGSTTPKTEERKEQQHGKPQPQPPSDQFVKRNSVAKKPLIEREGILLAAEFAKTIHGHHSYRLEIQGDKLGTSHEIWGIGLKRALDGSEAKIGDKIRVFLVGCADTSLGSEGAENVQNKIYEIIKLE